MGNNLNEVFEIHSVNENMVVIEIKDTSIDTILKYPFLQSKYKYITVTRGKEHNLCVRDSNGDIITSFHWGHSGYTLISDSLETLRRAIVKFCQSSFISLEFCKSSCNTAKVYYNPNYKKWQLTIDDIPMYWSENAKNLNEMIAECKRFVTSDKWEHKIANTGIDVWWANKPIYVGK